MPGSVFDQYQKYFESLITRHRTTCQLENQNHQRDTQEQQQQPPPQQQQQSQRPPQTQQPQYQQQDYTPVDDGRMRRQMPSNWQPEYPMYAPQHMLMKQPYQQQYDTPDYGRGGARLSQQFPYQQIPQHQLPPQQQQFDPEDYQYYGRPGARPQQQMQPPMDMRPPVPVSPVAPDATFRPDGRAEAAADPNKKQETLCYPFGVNGYQGGGPCGPCTSCTAKPAPPVAPAVQQQQQQPQQQQQRQQQKPCDSKDCSSGWRADGGPDEAASSAPARERLPLGVDEPFVIGPTTYQYFFDRPA